jgi:hypothetical protein
MERVGLPGMQQVDLFICCRNLKDMDYFSKSDPFVVLKIIDTHSGSWVEADRTEVIE